MIQGFNLSLLQSFATSRDSTPEVLASSERTDTLTIAYPLIGGFINSPDGTDWIAVCVCVGVYFDVWVYMLVCTDVNVL